MNTKAISKSVRILLFVSILLAAFILPLSCSSQTEARSALTIWLRAADGDYNNEARAGQDNKFLLEMRNIGDTPLTNIRLSAEEPEGWLVIIKPAVISSLGADSQSIADVNIKPAGGAIRQRYEVRFTAEANEVRQVESFSVTVLPTQSWIWVWVAAGVLLVAVFVFIYMRLNKQG